MITFNDIYEASRKERYSEQLQELSKTFLSDVADYLREKKEIASKESDTFSDIIIKTKKQLENAKTLFSELKRLRRKKILNLVLIAAETGISKRDFENMLPFEKELFEELMKCIDSSNKNLNEILNGKEEKQKNILILFKTDVGEFLGLNGQKMGEFKRGEVANIPHEIARILVDDKKAEYIEE